MRGRSSYTPSPSPPPPRGHGRIGPSPTPRGNRYRDLSATLFVRNLSQDCRQKDLRSSFGQFGPLRNINLPRDCNRGYPRGYGYVEFEDRDDAAVAKDQMDGNLLLGRELSVVFAEDNWKKPPEMRASQRGDGRFRDRRRSPSRYYSRSPRSSCSPLPSRRRHSSHNKEGYDRRRRSYSRSPTYSGSRGRSITRKSRSRDLSATLFVHNLSHDCRQEDIRNSFKQFGPLKDIRLPRDHHTGDGRGFGFVQFEDPADAAKAKDHMDGYVLLGRKLVVVFARDRGDGRFRNSRRSPSRSPPTRRGRSRSRSGDYYTPPSRRHHSRKEGYGRRRSYSRSPAYNCSRGRSASPATIKSRRRSRSPRRSISRSPSRRSNTPLPARSCRSPSPRRRRSNTPLPASRNRSPRLKRRRSNTPLPTSRNRSPGPRRRRSNTPLPASRNRSPRLKRRRSNTPLPTSRNRSPGPRRRRSNTPLPASRNRSPRLKRRRSNTPVPPASNSRTRRSNTPVPARSHSPRGEQ